VSIQENYNSLSSNPTTQNTVVTDRSLRLNMLLASAFVLAAVLPWWNHYIGVTNDAWHYFYGQQILAGKVPYRDFYLFVTPLGPLKNASLIALFGNHIIVPHIVAIVELMILAMVLVAWISRLFPEFETAVGVTTAMALYIFCMTSEALSGLHQEAVFFPVLAGWVASLALSRKRTGFFALAGMLAGMALLAKQTSGVATLACLGILLPILLWRLEGVPAATKATVSYASGAVIPLALVSMWLGRNGAMEAFVSDTFLRGSTSKGPLLGIILRPFFMIGREIGYQLEVLLAIGCLGIFFWFSRRAEIKERSRESEVSARSRLLLFYATAVAAVLLGVTCSRFFSLQRPHVFFKTLPKDFLLFFGEIGCFALFLRSAWNFSRFGIISERQAQVMLLTGFGCGLAYLLGCSWVDYVPIVLPSLAVVLTYVLYQLSARTAWSYARAAVLAVCVLAIVQFCALRMGRPFGWSGWREPNVHSATKKFGEPELAGFAASVESARFVDGITQDIVINSKPADAVLAYTQTSLSSTYCRIARRRHLLMSTT
jgi:hypothetical protein